MELDFKIKVDLLLLKIGKVKFTEKIGISYGKFLRMNNDHSKFSLKQVNTINELYKEYFTNE